MGAVRLFDRIRIPEARVEEVAGAVVAKGPDCPRRRVAIGGDTDRLLAGVLRCDGRLGDAGQSTSTSPSRMSSIPKRLSASIAPSMSPVRRYVLAVLADRSASLGDLLSDLADHEVDQEPGTRFVGCWSSSKGGDPRERGVDESAALPDRARLAAPDRQDPGREQGHALRVTEASARLLGDLVRIRAASSFSSIDAASSANASNRIDRSPSDRSSGMLSTARR